MTETGVWDGLHCLHWFEEVSAACCRCRYTDNDDQQCHGYIGAAPCWTSVLP